MHLRCQRPHTSVVPKRTRSNSEQVLHARVAQRQRRLIQNQSSEGSTPFVCTHGTKHFKPKAVHLRPWRNVDALGLSPSAFGHVSSTLTGCTRRVVQPRDSPDMGSSAGMGILLRLPLLETMYS